MTEQLPLLVWEKHAAHYRLQEKREQLLNRIAKLKPKAMKRIELEIQLRESTRQQMAIENELYGRRGAR